MSDELAKEAESLLKSTSILNHKYGIPIVEPNQTATNIQQLELKYYTIYKSLNHKLNKLMYLNKLQEIRDLPEHQIKEQVEVIKQKTGISDTKELLDFLQLQDTEIKTNRLLLRYFLMTKPILKSVHQSELNSSEHNILNMLNELYDEENGLIYKQNQENEATFNRDNYDLITEVIKPLIEKSKELNKTLKVLNKKYVNNKEEIVQETLINEGDKRQKFYDLVNRWDKLMSMCLEIPGLIMDLPINWYDNEELRSIMEEIDVIQIKLNKYQLIVNKDTVSMFTTTELLALEYPE